MTSHSRKARKRRTLSKVEREKIVAALKLVDGALAIELADAIIIIEVPQHTHTLERVGK